MSDLQPESKSHVKIWTTAKGDPQWEVKQVAGTPDAELDAARKVAVAQFKLVGEALGASVKVEARDLEHP